MSEFQTSKTDLTIGRIVETSRPKISAGEVLVKIDRFAFTANNVTYAVMGDALRYWEFFQSHNDSNNDWGIIPAWGFADVIEFQSDDIVVGERFFGYFPPADYVAMTPSKLTRTTFIEASEHRQSLPVGYNLYRRVSNESGYDKTKDDERMLLFVLHLTAFCLYDMLRSNDWFDAEQIIIISASSKTSMGLAYGLATDTTSPKVVGLTSERNVETVRSFNAYDEVHSYGDLEKVNANVATVIIDMSGDSSVLSLLHKHLKDNMVCCSNVGLTHWDQSKPADGIISERSHTFFAPSQIQKRMQEWGAGEFEQRSLQFISHSCAKSAGWLKIVELDGLNGLANKYQDIVNGQIVADQGLIVVM